MEIELPVSLCICDVELAITCNVTFIPCTGGHVQIGSVTFNDTDVLELLREDDVLSLAEEIALITE